MTLLWPATVRCGLKACSKKKKKRNRVIPEILLPTIVCRPLYSTNKKYPSETLLAERIRSGGCCCINVCRYFAFEQESHKTAFWFDAKLWQRKKQMHDSDRDLQLLLCRPIFSLPQGQFAPLCACNVGNPQGSLFMDFGSFFLLRGLCGPAALRFSMAAGVNLYRF